MNRRLTITSAILTLLIVIGLFGLMTTGNKPSTDDETTSDIGREPNRSSRRQLDSRAEQRPRLSPPPRLAHLITKYGKERVEHAQRICPHYLSYNKKSEHTVNTIFSSPPHAIVMSHKLITNLFGVTLSSDQEEEVTALCHQYALRELSVFENARQELEEKLAEHHASRNQNILNGLSLMEPISLAKLESFFEFPWNSRLSR